MTKKYQAKEDFSYFANAIPAGTELDVNQFPPEVLEQMIKAGRVKEVTASEQRSKDSGEPKASDAKSS